MLIIRLLITNLHSLLVRVGVVASRWRTCRVCQLCTLLNDLQFSFMSLSLQLLEFFQFLSVLFARLYERFCFLPLANLQGAFLFLHWLFACAWQRSERELLLWGFLLCLSFQIECWHFQFLSIVQISETCSVVELCFRILLTWRLGGRLNRGVFWFLLLNFCFRML